MKSTCFLGQFARTCINKDFDGYYAFRMLFMLPRDCSASGMFAVHNT